MNTTFSFVDAMEVLLLIIMQILTMNTLFQHATYLTGQTVTRA